MSNVVQRDLVQEQDTAPWIVKEIRVYGISGLVLIVAIFGIKILYDNSRLDQRESNETIRKQFVELSAVTQNSTQAVQKNTEAVNALTQKLEKK